MRAESPAPSIAGGGVEGCDSSNHHNWRGLPGSSIPGPSLQLQTMPTLSKQQAARFPSEEDVVTWPYPRPMVTAGRGQRRRAKRLLSKQKSITQDSRMHCLIISRKGSVVGIVPSWDL